jgi:hypothetical protein
VDLEIAGVSIPGVDLEADRGAGLMEARAGVSAAPMASALVQASPHKVLESLLYQSLLVLSVTVLLRLLPSHSMCISETTCGLLKRIYMQQE